MASILRHRGRLYIATGLGVYYLQTHQNAARTGARNYEVQSQQPVFMPVRGIQAQSWSLLAVRDALLVATPFGVYQITDDTAAFMKESVSGGFAALTLYRSSRDSSRVFIGLYDGLAVLRYEHGHWLDEGRVAGIHEPIWSIEENAQGQLWMGTESQGVLRVAFANDPLRAVQVERFDYRHGLPRGWVGVYSAGGHPVFTSDEGLFRYDETQHTFHRDSTFGGGFADGSRDVEVVVEDHHGNVWLGSEEAAEINYAEQQPSGAFVWMQMPAQRFPKAPIWAIYPEKNDITWFGGPDGLLRYDANIPTSNAQEFAALIRRVKTSETSSIFGGAPKLQLAESSVAEDTQIVVLPYSRNALRFEYSATSFAMESENRFQTFLAGYDEGWSDWTKVTQKEYTNLFEGEYRFHVRARNTYQHVSREDVYVFRILPPWYRTWWAYASYGVLLAAGALGVDRVQRKRVLRKERARARMREAELRAQTAEAQAHALRAETARQEVELQKAAEIKSAYHA
ncbi:hypothetical protein HUU05_30665, partial [candidate division KSB1 bacterium]|nr:hypothetical protein [candidate division KSB1 bacterium]